MVTRISTGAAQQAQKAGVELTQLSEAQRAAIDADGNGEVSTAEAEALTRAADLDGDGFVDARERAHLPELFTGAGTRAALERLERAAWPALCEQAAARDELTRSEKKAADAAGSEALESARRALDLEGKKAALDGAVGDLERAKGELTQHRQALANAEHALTLNAEAARRHGPLAARAAELEAQLQLHADPGRLESARRAAAQGGAALAEWRRLDAAAKKMQDFDPQLARAELNRLAPELKRLEGAEKAHRTARHVLATGRDRTPALERAVGDAQGRLELARASHAEAAGPAAVLDRQLQYLGASRRLERGAARLEASRAFAWRVQRVEAKSTAEQLDGLRALLADAKREITWSASPEFKAKVVAPYQRAVQVEQARRHGTLKDSEVDRVRLGAELNAGRGAMDAVAKAIERDAAAVRKRLADPAFMAAFATLGAREQAAWLNEVASVQVQTPEGRAWLRDTALPALNEELGADAGLKAAFKSAFKAASVTHDAALAFLKTAGVAVAGSLKGGQLLEDSLAAALNLRPGELSFVRQATELLNRPGNPDEKLKNREAAKALLEKSGLPAIASKLDAVADTFTALHTAVGLAQLVGDLKKNPELFRDALGLTKGVIDATVLSQRLTKYLTEDPAAIAKYGSFCKVLGSVGSAVAVVQGYLSMYDAQEGSVARGDVKGTVVNASAVLAAELALLGTAATATGVGAPLGVPLQVASALIAAGGGVYELLYGDSDAKKWLRANTYYASR